MISNYEFIKTQAFEVSWAVFRCTELFSQTKLRGEVEAAAVDLIADYNAVSEVTRGEFPRIERLTSLIRLAESVGQIASVNANVLYRELDNLTKAIRLEVVERREKENITASLERIFTNSAYTNSLANATVQQNTPAESADQKAGDRQFGTIESLLSAAVHSSQPITKPVEEKAPVADVLNAFLQAPSASSGQAVSAPVERPVSAIVAQPSSAAVSTPVNPAPVVIDRPIVPAVIRPTISATPTVQAGSWQHVILQKVKDLGQTTTKELAASFPEISERTIRFYLQKLVDNGAIDRIGSTGPGAAYKAK